MQMCEPAPGFNADRQRVTTLRPAILGLERLPMLSAGSNLDQYSHIAVDDGINAVTESPAPGQYCGP